MTDIMIHEIEVKRTDAVGNQYQATARFRSTTPEMRQICDLIGSLDGGWVVMKIERKDAMDGIAEMQPWIENLRRSAMPRPASQLPNGDVLMTDGTTVTQAEMARRASDAFVQGLQDNLPEVAGEGGIV